MDGWLEGGRDDARFQKKRERRAGGIGRERTSFPGHSSHRRGSRSFFSFGGADADGASSCFGGSTVTAVSPSPGIAARASLFFFVAFEEEGEVSDERTTRAGGSARDRIARARPRPIARRDADEDGFDASSSF